jgi:Pyruvate/2-oxoacid:ferredoxin oxidoreductase delta subunit
LAQGELIIHGALLLKNSPTPELIVNTKNANPAGDKGDSMSDEPYLKLREFLDQFPIGFPQTDSGVEIKILKRLFSPEEAEITIQLSPLPEQASSIAARTGLSEEHLATKLEAMAKNGLIFRLRRDGKTLFLAAPFMIGLYEYSVKKIDRELAELFKQYYDEAYQEEMGSSNVPGFKVIPLQQNVQADIALLPYHKIEEDIRSTRVIAVTECVCRKEAALTGHQCRHPVENCLSFGAAAEFYIENGMGRQITADEAIEIVKKADESGLVHAGANAKHLSNICNCCPCCCASMKGIVTKDRDRQKFMNALFEAVVDEAQCTACEICLERCPVDAITVEDTAMVDRDKCLGCGLCASDCSMEAIAMHLREDRLEPFERVFDMGMAMLKAKQANTAGRG